MHFNFWVFSMHSVVASLKYQCCDAALRNICSLNIQQGPLNDCKSQSTLLFDPQDKHLKMCRFKYVDIFFPHFHFYTFFLNGRPEFPLAAIMHWRFTTKRYCFTEAACLSALYIKRARANIIPFWIFMGTKRSLPILFASRLKRMAPLNILHVFHKTIYLVLYLYSSMQNVKNNSYFHVFGCFSIPRDINIMYSHC